MRAGRVIQGTRAYQPSRILENEGQYDPVDLDGTNVLPTLRRRRQKRIQYALNLSFHLVEKPM
jgi:hypothetical protein